MVHYSKKSFSFLDNFLRITLVAKEINVDLGGQKGGVIDIIKELTHRQKEILKIISTEHRISHSAIADNHQYTCPVATAVLHQKNVLQLSSYEEEILLLLAKGFKQNEISKLLKEKDISPNSVRSLEANISRLKDYFNATNTTHLVYLVSNLGLI